ncbi:MAG: indole-3-glycerol phosphate synthase TrpC [Bacteroidetes bacterium]|nr:indole-3-glycerol phosphate synthase TrpC [Bacteroidota bacterium]
MSNILEDIIAWKAAEVEIAKQNTAVDQLLTGDYFKRTCFSLKTRLLEAKSSGIIAEFKRRSPSKGMINETAMPEEVAVGYRNSGVSGMSVLTDSKFFGGSFLDFKKVRATADLPLLRKDFIIDEYQVYETKSIGADVMLLIAANLEVKQCHQLAAIAKQLGLEVLLELHEERELDHISEDIDIVGINNRNLKTFTVDLEHSIQLAKKIPDNFVKISESGIGNPLDIVMLKQQGFKGFLIGENFMKTNDPGAMCKEFIDQIKAGEN